MSEATQGSSEATQGSSEPIQGSSGLIESSSEATRDALRRLLRERAVLRGDFVLSSGQRSSYYLDARLVTLSGAGSALVGEAFLELIRPAAPTAVAGLTLGADPIVTAIAVVSG